MSTYSTVQPPRRRTRGQRRVRQARTFFIIAVMAALVSVAGHCLTGDAPAPVSAVPAPITAPR